jgi:hypothetical protein
LNYNKQKVDFVENKYILEIIYIYFIFMPEKSLKEIIEAASVYGSFASF